MVSPQNQAVVARSAMAMKGRGEEPTYAKMVAACPEALRNPKTREPVGKKRVYEIMKSQCYDDPENPDDVWTHGPRNSKRALTASAMKLRYEWALAMQEERRTPAWLYENLVWTDICNTILPRTEKRQEEMTLARKAKKGSALAPECCERTVHFSNTSSRAGLATPVQDADVRSGWPAAYFGARTEVGGVNRRGGGQ